MREGYDGIGIFENVEVAGGGFSLENVVRSAAQRMIQGALEAEVAEFLQRMPGEKSEGAEGFRGYRNGYHKKRRITTAVGALTVKQPRVSDVPAEAGTYRSQLIKPYRRRSEALDILFPKLFIEGLATRDFEPALRALVGEDAPLSPSSVSRLNKQFREEYNKWKTRRLDDLEIVYTWADGVYLKAGISDEKLCALVVMGADRTGKKHLLAISNRLSPALNSEQMPQEDSEPLTRPCIFFSNSSNAAKKPGSDYASLRNLRRSNYRITPFKNGSTNTGKQGC